MLTKRVTLVQVQVRISDIAFKSMLVLLKSNVSSLKKISTPRLELCAAMLLGNILSYVKFWLALYLAITNVFAWSDSNVALYCMKSSPTRCKTLVGNRLALIQEKISPSFWHHIKGSEENRSDKALRGCFPYDPLNNSLWWGGTWIFGKRYFFCGWYNCFGYGNF